VNVLERPPGQRFTVNSRGRLVGRAILVVLTLYGLAMVVPDFYRLVRPLGSFGLTADNDGLIFDVRGQFQEMSDSPAWQAGLRAGDRIDLRAMRCVPVDSNVCATILAVRGGRQLVLPGRTAELKLAETSGHFAGQVVLVARQHPSNWLLDLVTFLDQIAGMLVVLGSAWLVWTRPGAMTWGFFIYAMQFNPGQDFEFYARLQQWPAALLAQHIADCLLQAAGYTGFVLFALRVPNDRTETPWRPVERALPWLAVGLGALMLLSIGSVFGHPTETLTRAGLIIGFFISALVVYILLARRKYLSPQDHQRMRWVIWGCLIGLPACMIAEIAQVTSLPARLAGGFVLPEDAIGLLYLVNGVLCIFVIEAIRMPRVINVSIPLRRATVLGLIVSAPIMLLHEQVNGVHEIIELPTWGWFIVAWLAVFVISRLHERTVHLMEGWFELGLRRSEERFAEIGNAILGARSAVEIDRLLIEAPQRALKLASSAVFRQDGAEFRREEGGIGWTSSMAPAIDCKSALLAGKSNGPPFGIDAELLDEVAFPAGPRQPALAAPVCNPLRCFAIALYGSHDSGADLDGAERGLIGKLAATAAVAYAQVEAQALRERVVALERELSLGSASAPQGR
jgi:hypothetical protein